MFDSIKSGKYFGAQNLLEDIDFDTELKQHTLSSFRPSYVKYPGVYKVIFKILVNFANSQHDNQMECENWTLVFLWVSREMTSRFTSFPKKYPPLSRWCFLISITTHEFPDIDVPAAPLCLLIYAYTGMRTNMMFKELIKQHLGRDDVIKSFDSILFLRLRTQTENYSN